MASDDEDYVALGTPLEPLEEGKNKSCRDVCNIVLKEFVLTWLLLLIDRCCRPEETSFNTRSDSDR